MSAPAIPAGLFLVIVLVQVPALVLGAGAADLQADPVSVAALLLVCAALATAALAASSIVVPPRARGHFVVALYGIAMFAWVRAGFFPGPSLALDGRQSAMKVDTGAIALVVPLAAGALAMLVAATSAALARRFTLLILLGVLLHAGVRISPAIASFDRGHGAQEARLAELSAQSNVLVILLDSFQSDLFDEMLRARPDLRSDLDGFTYYPDTLSTAPTTYLSLPDIHAGSDGVPADRALQEQFSVAIEQRSFLNSLSANGYETSYLRSVGGCPDKVANCASMPVYARGAIRATIAEARLLALFGLYRISPDAGRRRIAAGWITGAGASGADPVAAQVESGVRGLRRFASELELGGRRPKAVFVHSLVTHAPFILDENCSPRAEARDRDGALAQATCAMAGVVDILRRMQELGAYDRSLVVVLADHGHGMGSSRIEGGEGSSALRRLAGSVNPLLLVKAPARSGELDVSPARISLGDLAGALCGGSVCDAGGFQVALEHASDGQPRRLQMYQWKHEYWHMPLVPGTVRYRVDGSLFELRSWTAEDAPAIVGREARFGAGADGVLNAGFGWSNPEAVSMWSDGGLASLFVGPVANPGTPHDMSIGGRLYGATPATPRSVVVHVNGRPVGSLQSDGTQPASAGAVVTIPAGVLRGSSGNQILLEIVEPLNPPGPDERLLGIALESVHLQPVDVTDRPGPPGEEASVRSADDGTVGEQQ